MVAVSLAGSADREEKGDKEEDSASDVGSRQSNFGSVHLTPASVSTK